jgi:hypothetical protein
MKKIILTYSVFFIVLTTYIKAQTYSPVYTPNGTEVPAWITSELSKSDRAYWDSYFALHYPNAIQLSTYGNYSSTGRFNCHGYAWYMSENNDELSNPRWIGLGYNEPSDPEYSYWEDGSYIEVSSSNIFGSKVNWSSGDHSAITTNVQGVLISKWRFYPFMKHNWDDSPYGSSGLKYYIRPEISGMSTLCYSGSSYSIDNLPSDAIIDWSTNFHITRVSPQGSNPCTFRTSSSIASSESGIITATITINNHSFSISKVVDVGTQTPLIGIYNSSNHSQVASGFTNQQYYCSALGINLSTNGGDYLWTIIPPEGNMDLFPIIGNGTPVTFTPEYEGNYTISLEYNGQCGWSSQRTINFTVNFDSFFLLTPNPARTVVEVELLNSKNSDGLNGFSSESLDKKQYHVCIYDKMMRKQRSIRINQKKTSIDISNLSKGIYFVALQTEQGNHIEKLIVD